MNVPILTLYISFRKVKILYYFTTTVISRVLSKPPNKLIVPLVECSPKSLEKTKFKFTNNNFQITRGLELIRLSILKEGRPD